MREFLINKFSKSKYKLNEDLEDVVIYTYKIKQEEYSYSFDFINKTIEMRHTINHSSENIDIINFTMKFRKNFPVLEGKNLIKYIDS